MMSYRQKCFFALMIALFISVGCSQRHFVHIDPALPVSRSEFGKGLALGLKVIDSRQNNLISKWKGPLNFRSFSISPKEDLGEVLQKKITSGLRIIGFVPKRHASRQDRTLKVEILRLQSLYHDSNPRQGVKVSAVLRAQCRNKNHVFKMNYEDRVTRAPINPTSFPNENLVNASLSGALKKMFSDNRLLKCLVQ